MEPDPGGRALGDNARELALAFSVGARENYDETFCLFDCALRVSNCGC
jgi:hypothetical protein